MLFASFPLPFPFFPHRSGSNSNNHNVSAKELSNQWQPTTIKAATSFPSWRINR